MDPLDELGDRDGKLVGLIKKVNQQRPQLLARMLPSAIEARRYNRELGITPKQGQTHQEVSVVRVPHDVHRAVGTLASKLTKGIYYRETRRIFPNDGCLILNWFTNADLIRDGKWTTFDLLKEISGNVPPVVRGGSLLNDQFEYKVSTSPDGDLILLQSRFGRTFGFVTAGASRSGPLEGIVERLRARSGRQGPFAILQSKILLPSA